MKKNKVKINKVKKVKKNKPKKDLRKVLLKALIILLVIDIIFIPLFIFAEIKPLVGMTIFIFFPLVMAIFILLLSRSCLKSYENKKKIIEEKLNR